MSAKIHATPAVFIHRTSVENTFRLVSRSEVVIVFMDVDAVDVAYCG
jgi:hypothetical protein